MKRFAYAPNKRIGLNCLKILLEARWTPSAILLPRRRMAAYSDHIEDLVAPLNIPIFRGANIRRDESIAQLQDMDLDYIISVHFPEILRSEIISIPKAGTMNLHPAYLPYNRGWHTPSWAIWDQTPYGATLHWIDNGIDTGDIIAQRMLSIAPNDTAHSLYQKVLKLEEQLFEEIIPDLLAGDLSGSPQTGRSTSRKKRELAAIRKIEMDQPTTARNVILKLRALTTNKKQEAAYFDENGQRYLVRVEIIPDGADAP